MAYKRSLNRWANERDKQDMYEKGKEEGIEEGIKQGIEQGLEMGIEQGVMQGIGQGKYNLIKQLFNKLYHFTCINLLLRHYILITYLYFTIN